MLQNIENYRIIGKQIECEKTLEDHKQSYQVVSRQSSANNEDLDLLRDRVIKIMMETLWQRILDKTNIKSVYQKQSMLESQRHYSGRIESALTVSSILPTNRPSVMFKSCSNSETVSQNGLILCQQQK